MYPGRPGAAGCPSAGPLFSLSDKINDRQSVSESVSGPSGGPSVGPSEYIADICSRELLTCYKPGRSKTCFFRPESNGKAVAVAVTGCLVLNLYLCTCVSVYMTSGTHLTFVDLY